MLWKYSEGNCSLIKKVGRIYELCKKHQTRTCMRTQIVIRFAIHLRSVGRYLRLLCYRFWSHQRSRSGVLNISSKPKISAYSGASVLSNFFFRLIVHSASWGNRSTAVQKTWTDALEATLMKFNKNIYAESPVRYIFSQVPRINLAIYENMWELVKCFEKCLKGSYKFFLRFLYSL